MSRPYFAHSSITVLCVWYHTQGLILHRPLVILIRAFSVACHVLASVVTTNGGAFDSRDGRLASIAITARHIIIMAGGSMVCRPLPSARDITTASRERRLALSCGKASSMWCCRFCTLFCSEPGDDIATSRSAAEQGITSTPY